MAEACSLAEESKARANESLLSRRESIRAIDQVHHAPEKDDAALMRLATPNPRVR